MPKLKEDKHEFSKNKKVILICIVINVVLAFAWVEVSRVLPFTFLQNKDVSNIFILGMILTYIINFLFFLILYLRNIYSMVFLQRFDVILFVLRGICLTLFLSLASNS